MQFRNPNEYALSFKIDGVSYEVEPGATCEIPEGISYVVALHKLPLVAAALEATQAEPAAEEEKPAAAVAPPSSTQAQMWKRKR